MWPKPQTVFEWDKQTTLQGPKNTRVVWLLTCGTIFKTFVSETIILILQILIWLMAEFVDLKLEEMLPEQEQMQRMELFTDQEIN